MQLIYKFNEAANYSGQPSSMRKRKSPAIQSPSPEMDRQTREALFASMMKEIDAELSNLSKIVTIQAMSLTSDPNHPAHKMTPDEFANYFVNSRIKATTPPPIPQKTTPKQQGFFKNLWQKNPHEGIISIQKYNDIAKQVNEIADNMFFEELIPVSDATKQAINQFRGKLVAIVQKYFLNPSIPMNIQTPAVPSDEKEMEEIVDNSKQLNEKVLIAANEAFQAIKNLERDLENKKLAERLHESVRVLNQHQTDSARLKKEIEELQKKYKEKINELIAAKGDVVSNANNIISEKDKIIDEARRKIEEMESIVKTVVAESKKITTYEVVDKGVKTPEKSFENELELKNLIRASDEWKNENLPMDGEKAAESGQSPKENDRIRKEIETWFDETDNRIIATDRERAIEFMKKYNLNPCDPKDVKKIWPHHDNAPISETYCNKQRHESYSDFLAKKILEGTNAETKKRYYKYLLESRI